MPLRESHRLAWRLTPGLGGLGGLGGLVAVALLGGATDARAELLGPRGHVGSFHVVAPGAARSVLSKGSEIATAQLGTGAKARTVLAGSLQVSSEGDYLLIASGDGGLQLTLDGSSVFDEAAPRVYFAPGDVVPVHLTAGTHTLVATLTKSKAFALRAVGSNFRPSAALEWLTPALAPADPSDLAVTLSPTFEAGGVRLGLHVARLRSAADEQNDPLEIEVRGAGGVLFSASAGRLPYPRAETQVALPTFPMSEATALTVTVKHGVRTMHVQLRLNESAQRAVVRARAAARDPMPAAVKPGSQDSVLHLADVLEELARTQDPDQAFATQLTQELNELATQLEAGADPYAGRVGPQRRALRSPVDGKLYEFGLYVPAKPRAKTPLILVLHGLHGRPMTMLRYLFGGDDSSKTALQKDRSWDKSLPALDAYAIAPSGHADSTYRWLAEDESLRLVDWAKSVFPIDADKVTMTGASMGGIGAAAIPLHHPGVFAAAAPLCGYHSYFLRSDVTRFSKLPYERFQAEERSNVLWAENGHDLPMFIAHGTMDLPEANSGVLIDRYEELKYRIVHEHPNVGHNVWQPTYANLKGANWLTARTRSHPSRLRFRSVRPRYGQSYWLRVLAQERPDAWLDVRARHDQDTFTLTTSNVRELLLDRIESGVGDVAVRVTLDGASLEYTQAELLAAHKDERGVWNKGALSDAPAKRGLRTGPFRDLYHEPLAFVFGTRDPAFTAANEEVARHLSRVKPGVRVDYPVLRDDEAAGKIAPGTSVVLVGPARSNSMRAALDAKLPSHIDGTTLTFAGQKYEGAGIGAAYIYPHPEDPAAYVAIVEGVDPIAVRTAMALPELIPDYLVFDRGLAAARGQILMGRGKSLAAGYFDKSWNVPSK